MVITRHNKPFELLCCVFFVLLWHSKPGPGFISGVEGANIRCIDRERQALLKFKQELEDYSGFLSSWGSEEKKRDCCNWRGIGCNNRTGHITLLDLHFDEEYDLTPLRGNISNSLLELKHLNYLDLSSNNFFDSPFPNFASLHNLRYLNLSHIYFVGTLSYHLANLSRLQYLDLGSYEGDISFENLDWLSHLSSLENLDLSGNNLSQATDWLQAVNKLPRLEVLRLSLCGLSNSIPVSLSFINSSKSLSVLDLSENNLASSIFLWLSNFSNSLSDVDLSSNQLQGSVPEGLGNLSSLTNLDLSWNQLQGISRSFQQMCNLYALNLQYNKLNSSLSQFFQNLDGCTKNSLQILMLNRNELHGSFPDITRFPSMRELDLSYNQLNGTLPETFRQHSKLVSLILSDNQLLGSLPDLTMLSSLRELRIDRNRLDGVVPESTGSLSELRVLSVSGNSLQGVMSEAHFSNLSKLIYLDFSSNSIDFRIGSNWTPPFQLDTIHLRSCNLGPDFPKWLQSQNNFSDLDISYAGISDTIPSWFWDLSSMLSLLDLSHNQMSGILPDLSSTRAKPNRIDLSFNQLEGPLPLFPPISLISLDLSSNRFSGPASIMCNISSAGLGFLDLTNNLLSGKLPNDCFKNMGNLIGLILADNMISGEIPSSIGSLLLLQSLSLSNNSFSGELPSFLRNCSQLVFLDLSVNKLYGEIPAWIGETLLSLKFLSLQSNEFNGSIPQELCQLGYLQILDLSLNNNSGIIPKCLNNLTAMIQKQESNDIATATDFSTPFAYINKAWIEWKGREYKYERNLGLLRILDFAGNKLIGKIPEEVMDLVQLVVLNLSQNYLTGAIPRKVGQLRQLESLDLSGNRLTGEIPTGMADLNFLNYLNLSHNNLSGRIPSSTQLQSFDASSFAGNLALCGLPVTQKCDRDNTPLSPPANDDHQGNEDDEFWKWFYTAMGIGFAVFFWGVSCALLLKTSWRHAYFHFLDESRDWFYETIFSRA